ncbi:hypothetical protein Droror1_Dr00024827 [Drosera rotundifolia]
MDTETVQSKWQFSCDLEVDYESDEKASIVHSALAVDKELQPDKVQRRMSVSEGKLSLVWSARFSFRFRVLFSILVSNHKELLNFDVALFYIVMLRPS